MKLEILPVDVVGYFDFPIAVYFYKIHDYLNLTSFR